MLKAAKRYFWSFCQWEFLEETFEQTRNGMMFPRYCGKAYVSMWVRSWDKEGHDLFEKTVKEIAKSGFVTATERNMWKHYC